MPASPIDLDPAPKKTPALSQRLREWLTRPAARISEPSHRRQAQLLAASLFILFVLILSLTLITAGAVPRIEQSGEFQFILVILFSLSLAYGLSRTPHYRAGAWLALLVVSIAIFVLEWTDPEGDSPFLYFLIIPLLLGNLFLSRPWLIGLAAINALGLVTLPLIFQSLTFIQLVAGPLGFLILITGLFLVTRDYYQLLEKDRRAQLAEKDDQYRTLLEQLPALTYLNVVNPKRPLDFVPAYVSPQFEALLGYTLADYLADPELWLKCIHPEDQPQVVEAYARQVGEALAQIAQEYRLLARGGRILWFRDESLLRRDEIQQRWLRQGLLLDITERKQHDREQDALLALSAALRSASDRAAMLPIILKQAVAVAQAEGAALVLREPQPGQRLTLVGLGQWANAPLRPALLERDISLQVMTTGQPYVADRHPTDAGPTISAMCVPLVSQGEAIGALWVTHPAPFTAETLRLLIPISDLAANAIQRTTFYEQAQQQLKHLEALRAIDMAITASLDLRVMLNILLDQVTTQLEVGAAAVLLLNPHTQIFEYSAGRGFRTDRITRGRQRLGEGYVGRAALERRSIQIPDLNDEEPDFSRARLIQEEGFQAYYNVPLIAKGLVLGVLEIFHHVPLTPNAEWLNFLETLAGQAALAVDHTRLFNELQRSNIHLTMAYDATIEGWSRALDLRDKETEGHTQRVTEITVRLAQALNFSEAELVHVRRGALLHDIGKMGIPDAILLKPGPLTPDERQTMQLHPVYAYEMLAPISYLRQALDIPYAHHERWDSTGYPRGLRGEQIPLAARLFAVVDVWDALRSDRPYRLGWAEARVLEHIQAGSGTHFDPEVVKIFMQFQAKPEV